MLPPVPAQSNLLATFTSHYDGLVNYVRRRFGNQHFAQDVVQDVCVHIMERPEKAAHHFPIAFLKKISHDIAIDRYRQQKAKARWIESLAELPEIVCPAPDQFRQLAAKQELECLAQTIRNLPPRCQQVFIMHKIHELPQAEVAFKLGISLKAVEKHLKQGMLVCRNCLNLDAV